jgi:hypothetical protein
MERGYTQDPCQYYYGGLHSTIPFLFKFEMRKVFWDPLEDDYVTILGVP